MEDPYASLEPYCHYSSSQEEIFKNSLIVREKISPEPEPSPPSRSSPATAAFKDNGIVICSAPETPASETAASRSGDEFETPPKESRRSSSEEAPPPPPPQTLSPSPGGHGMSAVETDCVALDGGTLDLGFSQDGNRSPKMVETPSDGSGALDGGTLDLGFSQGGSRTPKMVEVLSGGKVRVGEVSKLDLESFRVGEKRQLPVQTPSPSKRIRVSLNTPNLECPTEIGVNVNTEVETQVNDVDSEHVEADQMNDTDVIKGYENGKEDCANSCGISTVEQGHEEEEKENGNGDKETVVDVDSGHVEADQMIDTDAIKGYENGKEDCVINGGISTVEQKHEEEEEKENGNGDKETVVDDGAEDLSKLGRRCLPKWTCQNGGNREDRNRSNTERGSSDNRKLVLEVLTWLAREKRRERGDRDDGPVDFLETAKRRGVTFP